jgi:hypothetical protein
LDIVFGASEFETGFIPKTMENVWDRSEIDGGKIREKVGVKPHARY